RVEKLAALQFRIELMPVEQTESLGVRRSLPPRANERQLGVVRKEIAIEHFDKRVQLGVPDEIVCRLIVEIRLSDCDRRQIDNKIQQAVGGDLRRVVEEGIKVAMKSGCSEIPVDEEAPPAADRQEPGDVRQRHGSAGASFVGIEGDDLAVSIALCHEDGLLLT